jgi:peptidoglycan/LPS O-acetylase OafA/YrhL
MMSNRAKNRRDVAVMRLNASFPDGSLTARWMRSSLDAQLASVRSVTFVAEASAEAISGPRTLPRIVGTTAETESPRAWREGQNSTAPQYAYQPALDGVRAFAVGSVMLYHAGQSWALGGFLGVDAFFVLSGFLITSLLVVEWSGRGRIDLAAFWGRRARRLLPALGLVILGIVAYAAVYAAPGEVERIRSDGFATIGYVANWKFIFAGQSYFDQFTQPSPFRHMWSLAIEEQFYLLWPLIVFGILWFTRSVRALLAAAIAMLIGSAVLMAVLHQPAHDPSRVYYGTDTRAQSLLMGAIAGILVYFHGPIRSTLARTILRVAAAAGAVYTLWIWSNTSERSDALYRGGFLLASLSVAVVIVSVTQPDRGLLGRALSWAPLRWIGMISYGLYLWHWPVYLTFTGTRTGLSGTGLLLARVAVTTAVATASFYLVERPIRRGTFTLPRPAVLAPVVAGALVVALVVATTGAGTSPANAAQASIANQPDAHDRRAATNVLLLGDSIAASLGVGLLRLAARDDNLSAVSRATLGCGMLRGHEIKIGVEPTEQGATCNDWDERWLAPIDEFNPNVVVLLIGAWDVLDRRVDGRWVKPGDAAFDRFFLSELEDASRLLTSSGAQLVVLTTPYFSRPELVGQTGHAWPEYDPSRVARINSLYRTFLAEHPRRFTLVDLNRYVSPRGKFTDTLNGIFIRDDGVHFTADGATYVSRWLVPKLEALTAKSSDSG